MLAHYLDFHAVELSQLERISRDPFSTVGFYREKQDALNKQIWLHGKHLDKDAIYRFDKVFNIVDTLTVLDACENEQIVKQAFLQLIPSYNTDELYEFINALYVTSNGKSLARNIVIDGSLFHLLSDAISDIELIAFKLLFSEQPNGYFQQLQEQEKHGLNWLLSPVGKGDDTATVITTFKWLVENNLIESSLMKLFLRRLDTEQVKLICNYSAQSLPEKDALLILAKSGLVKYTNIVVSALNDNMPSTEIISEIRQTFGFRLEQLVPYEIQVSAYHGDELALDEFKKQFNAHWEAYLSQLTSDRLLCGHALVDQLTAAELEALDNQSYRFYQLYIRYLNVRTTALKGAA